MMSGHTKGPWVASGREVRLPGEERILNIAKAQTHLAFGHTIPWSEAEANARLIAAAPELLEACHAAIAMLRGCGLTESTKTICHLRRVISKAEDVWWSENKT